MRVTFLCYLLLVVVGLNRTCAQQYAFRSILDEELPSAQCNFCLQDHKGYMWVATNSGLVKYDGSSVKIFTTANGLSDNTIYRLWEDEQGRMFYVTRNNIPGYIQNDMPYALPIAPVLAGMVGKMSITSFSSYDKDHILITTQKGYFITDRKSLSHLTALPSQPKETFWVKVIGNNTTVAPDSNEINTNLPPTQKAVLFTEIGVSRKSFIVTTGKNYGKRLFKALYLADHRLMISCDRKLFILHPDGHNDSMFFPGSIISMVQDNDFGIWINMLNSGAYYFPNANLNHWQHLFPGLSVTCELKDREGAIWVTTSDGMFYCPSLSIINYRNIKPDGLRATAMCHLPGNIVVSGQGDTGYLFRNKNTYTIFTINTAITGGISDYIKYENRIYAAGNLNSPILDTTFRPHTYLEYNNYGVPLRYIIATKNRGLLGLQYDKLGTIEGRYLRHIIKLNEVGKDIAEDGNDRVFLGTTHGISLLTQDSLVKLPGINDEISRLRTDSKGRVWICTRSKGLYLMDGTVPRQFCRTPILSSDKCRDVAFDNNGNIWIATSNGICCTRTGRQATVYTTWDGLMSNDILRLAIKDSELYINTAKGLCIADMHKLRPTTVRPNIYIDSIFVNQHTAGQNTYFKSNENSIVLTLDGIYFKNAANLSYRYRLLPDTNWHLSASKKIIYNALEQGAYTFEARAVAYNGMVSNTAVYRFTIAPPFWRVWWFVLLEVAALVAVCWAIISWRIRSVKRKEAKKTELNRMIAEYKLVAVQAQMNPHFIFNAINSIQHYILSNEAQYAYDYLALFSKLIRQVLNSSSKTTATITNELELLRLYLDLEMKRLDGKLTYSIDDHNIPADEVEIPVMLIQPYVENSIWHGIMNLPQAVTGHIAIDLWLKDQTLKIAIKDNGIGRAKAMQYNHDRQHKPVGMMLSHSRIDILKAINPDGADIVITDLYDNDGNAAGTLVEIFIHINDNYAA